MLFGSENLFRYTSLSHQHNHNRYQVQHYQFPHVIFTGSTHWHLSRPSLQHGLHLSSNR